MNNTIDRIKNNLDIKQNDLSSLENQKEVLQNQMANPTALNDIQSQIDNATREVRVLEDVLLFATESKKVESMTNLLNSFEDIMEDIIESAEDAGEETEELKKELELVKDLRDKEASESDTEIDVPDFGSFDDF